MDMIRIAAKTTALGKEAGVFTLGFHALVLATFILAALPARSSGTWGRRPKIQNVMDSLATVLT